MRGCRHFQELVTSRRDTRALYCMSSAAVFVINCASSLMHFNGILTHRFPCGPSGMFKAIGTVGRGPFHDLALPHNFTTALHFDVFRRVSVLSGQRLSSNDTIVVSSVSGEMAAQY